MVIPKWDNIDGYLPYRYFISDYLWNGHLPLWNPFQRLGYPGYSDLQSGCWNPITWGLMFFGKYTIGSLVAELLLCYIIAGLGMYKLGNYLYHNPKTSFIIAICYSLSGFMVGSTQLMVFLIGVAWLPWCIFAFLKFLKTQQYKYALLTAFVFSISTSAASPAYTIVLVYIFMAMGIYFLWINRKESKKVKRIVLGGLMLVGCSAVLLSSYIISFMEFAPYFNRIDKLPYQGFLLANPFTGVEYISFLFPYSVISKTELFNHTDLSLRNGYFGIVGIVYLLLAIWTVRKKSTIVLLVGLFLALILALGDTTFFYKIAYNLPGFGVFRHPSFFRTYIIFCGLLLAGFAINNTLNKKKFINQEKIIFIGIFTVVLVGVIVSFFYTSKQEVLTNLYNVWNDLERSESSIYTHVFINGVVLLMLAIGVYALHRIFRLSTFVTLVLFVMLDMGVQTQLTAPTTIYNNISYAKTASFFRELPNEIEQKYNDTPMKILDETQGFKSTEGFWQNLSTLNKTPSVVGINPMRFKSFEEGVLNGAFDRNIENAILFFPTKERKLDQDSVEKGLIWGVNQPIKIVKGSTQLTSPEIGYNEFNGKVKNTANVAQWLILNQNYHHNWKAYYHNTSLQVYKVNQMVMGVKIPKNSEGDVQFVFESPNTFYTAIISIIGYLLVIGFLLKMFVFNKKESSH